MKKFFFILVLAIIALVMIQQTETKKVPNPYKVLGINQNANDDEVRQAFKRRSKKYHPDRNKKDPRAKQKFQQVVNAYQLLKDSEKRRIYDQTGEVDPQPQGFQGGGFPGGGFGFPGGGFGGFPGGGGFQMDMDDFMNMNMGGGFGGFQGHPGGGRPHGQRRPRRAKRANQRTHQGYTFSYGGQQGSSFNFDL